MSAARNILVLALALSCNAVAIAADAPAPATQPAPDTATAAAQGKTLYEARCAACHDHARDRIPPRVLISTVRAPDDIVVALTLGAMRQQAAGLEPGDIRALAVFLTGREPGREHRDASANRCQAPAPAIELAADDWNGWGRDPSNRRFQPHPGFSAGEVPRLKLKWAFAYPGNVAFGQPTIVGGRVFVGGTGGRMHALDARTGCTLWTYEAGAIIRSTVVVGRVEIDGASRVLAWFGDDQGRLHALDAETGAVAWTIRPDDHPLARLIGTPRLDDGRLLVPVSSMEEVAAADPKYECCRFRGSVVALDPASGRKLWQSYTIRESPQPVKTSSAGTQQYGPAGGAVFNSPTVDVRRGLIYVGTGDSYTDVPTDGTDAVLALDRISGERRWIRQVGAGDAWLLGCTSQPHANCPSRVGGDLDFAASPLLVPGRGGRTMLVAAAKSGIVYGFDPDHDGRILWQTRIAQGSSNGSILWGLTSEGNRSFVATNEYDFVPGVGPGALFALDNHTGKVLWHKSMPVLPCGWGTAHCAQGLLGALTGIPGVVFSGSLDGRIRAFRARDGKLLWEFDTGHAFPAVNGGEAHGGGIDYGAQTVADGLLFVQSGSMRQPGNALLVFSVDGK